MANRFAVSFLSIAAATCFAPLLAMAGPATEYWLTAGDQSKIYVVQGNSIIKTITTAASPDLEYPIAIGDTVRTFSGISGTYGREYQSDGTLTGNTYVNDGTFTKVWDGTTDGKSHNYSLQQDTGNVIQYDRDWANPTVLFTIPGLSSNWGGITFDSSNSSLWFNSREVSAGFLNFSLDGTLLKFFTLPGSTAQWGLAYEQSTDSLWCRGGSSSILHISKSGTLLETIPIPGLSGNILGGEMKIVPEPSTLALVGCGALVLATTFWRNFGRRARPM